jgi:hypothetical protein
MTANVFTRDFVQAVSDWQRKPKDRKQRYKRAVALQEQCAHLPDRFRQTSLTCYRQMALDKQSVWKLLGVQALDEQVSSWTLDMSVAKTLFGGVPQADTGLQDVIFAIFPKPEQVVVNLKMLLDDEEFKQAVQEHKGEVTYFEEGTGKYKNDQSEIVLNIGELVETDIWSLGGRSSSFDQLVFRAFTTLHNREPVSQEEFDAFRAEVDEMESQAGARWLEYDSTQRALQRTRPQAEVLRAIKAEQELARKAADEQLRAALTGDAPRVPSDT